MDSHIDFTSINAAALAQARSLLPRLVPGGKFRGLEYIVLNPRRDDQKPGSFSINYREGVWKDFSSGEGGSDLISLVAYLRGDCPQGEAAIELGNMVGVSTNGYAPNGHSANGHSAPSTKTIVLPVPANAPPAADTHPALGKSSGQWAYRDATGAVIGYVCRFGSGPDKQYRPQTLWRSGGRMGWEWKSWSTPRPLYGLEKLAERDADVVVVEGEKAADAAAKLLPNLVVVTSPHGSNSAGEADWSPLRGRNVTVWPDADAPGSKYAGAVSECIKLAGVKSVAIVASPEGVAEGWDAADALAEGWDQERAEALIAIAKSADESPEWKAVYAEARDNETSSKPRRGRGPHEWSEPKPLPDALAPVQPFSLEFLSPPIARWVGDISDRLQCPPDYVGVSAMTALGSVIGRRLAIAAQMKTDWFETPNPWGCFIGPPGMLKSPAMRAALSPLRRLEAEAAKANKLAMEEYQARVAAHAIQKQVALSLEKERLKKEKNAKGNIKLDIDPVPEEPVAKRFRTNDSSYEALGELLIDNPFGVLVERDELISLLSHLDREDQANARGFYLSGWSGTDPYTFDRIIRGHRHIDGVCISVLGNTQPAKIARYVHYANSTGGGDGLIQRFGLMVWPDTMPDWKDVDEYPNPTYREEVYQIFSKLSQIDERAALALGAIKGEFDPIPYLRFDEEAHAEFLEWRTPLEKRLRGGGLSEAMEGHLAKYRKLVPALSLINHVTDNGTGPVPHAPLMRALAFSNYLESHAHRIYGAANTLEVGAAKAILARIGSGDLKDGFSAREVQRHGWSRLTDREHVQLGIDLLVELGHLASQENPTGEYGGRPTLTYNINPKVKPSQ